MTERLSRYATKAKVKCDECELTKPHMHCTACNHALPYSIIYMGQSEPLVGESLRIIPSNYVVMCPSCGDGVLIRVKGRLQ